MYLVGSYLHVQDVALCKSISQVETSPTLPYSLVVELLRRHQYSPIILYFGCIWCYLL